MPNLVPLKTKDGRFRYEAAGDPAHTPLAFAHEIGGAARAWRAQLDFFGGRYRAIAWDMPGYGGSAPLAAVSIASLADALRDFLQHVGATNPILVGHSIGGMIVQQVLAKHPISPAPSSLRKQVQRSASPTATGKEPSWTPRLGPLDRGETMVSLAPTLVKELVGDDPDAGGMDLARDCMASVPGGHLSRTMLALMGFNQRSALGNIAVPTLVLSGSKDSNAPAPMMAKMATYIPSAKYVELEGAGHLVNLEQPRAFNAALDQFLNAHVAATRVTA